MKAPLAVLVVDDEETVRKVCARGIGPADSMTVITAADGKEALARLEKDRFDVLLTDLVMEPLDGFKLTETARRKYPWMDVIVMTGYGTFDHVVKAIKLGASDFILKPMEILLLKAALRRCAERRTLQGKVIAAAAALRSAAAELGRLELDQAFAARRDACVSALERALSDLESGGPPARTP